MNTFIISYKLRNVQLDIYKKITELNDKINEIKEDNESFKNAQSIIEFYNTLTTENMDSFVTVRSENTKNHAKKYTNGIIIGNIGNNYYVLTDYDAIIQNNMSVTIMDSYTQTYVSTSLYAYDTTTGVGVIKFTKGYVTSHVSSIETGNYTDTFALLDSMEQLNKATIYTNIKSSTMTYNDTTYTCYSLDDTNVNNGSVLINKENKLMAIYSSTLDTFISSELIKEIIDFI